MCTSASDICGRQRWTWSNIVTLLQYRVPRNGHEHINATALEMVCAQSQRLQSSKPILPCLSDGNSTSQGPLHPAPDNPSDVNSKGKIGFSQNLGDFTAPVTDNVDFYRGRSASFASGVLAPTRLSSTCHRGANRRSERWLKPYFMTVRF